MAGAQPAHNLLASRVGYLLQACLENTDCLLYIADQLVHLPMCERFTYPDVVIVCQKPVYTKSASGLMALANPAIIIEILSEGTEAYDRGEKFACYQSLDSLRQYILVSSQHKSRVEVYTRKQENHWDYISEDKLEARIKLGECDLLLKDIYKKVPLEE
jgi:Uma2 family endonuclease